MFFMKMANSYFQRAKCKLEVKRYLEQFGGKVQSFQATHREIHTSAEGDFEIDITVRFRALEIDWLTLVECKCYTHPVERKVVMELKAKKDTLKADKAILFATSSFQIGAIEYAQYHGIILCHFQKALLQRFGTDLPDKIEYIIYLFDGLDRQGQTIPRQYNYFKELLKKGR